MSISSKILPKVESKQDLITVVYDYNLSDIECVLTANDTLKENGLEIANPLIINATSIKETDAQLPIHTRKEMDVNGEISSNTSKSNQDLG